MGLGRPKAQRSRWRPLRQEYRKQQGKGGRGHPRRAPTEAGRAITSDRKKKNKASSNQGAESADGDDSDEPKKKFNPFENLRMNLVEKVR